jgi:hypothetical protein
MKIRKSKSTNDRLVECLKQRRRSLNWVLLPVVFFLSLWWQMELTTVGIDISTSSSLGSSNKPRRNWAYAFLMAGCDAENPSYRGMMYNILVAAYILKESGSRADVVAIVEMSPSAITKNRLPYRDLIALQALDVKVKYLPTPKVQNFYTIIMEKFQILSLSEYSRVMFLDGDVQPLCNLDYLFDLSEPLHGPPVLKENILQTMYGEACNAGLFVMSPGPREHDQLKEIIARQEVKAMTLPPPAHFNETEGWGHVITPPDRYVLVLD